MADRMSWLLETTATLIADRRSVGRHVGTDMADQDATVFVTVGTVDPLAIGVNDGALHVLVGEMKL